MAYHGFGRATLEELITLRSRLLEGEGWKDISAEGLLDLARRFNTDLTAVNAFVFHKADILGAIEAASEYSVSEIDEELKKIDPRWDSIEERMELRTRLILLEGPEEKRQAALRVRDQLELREGNPQTRLQVADELAFAQKQLVRATQRAPEGQRPLSEDIALIELNPLLDELRLVTAEMDRIHKKKNPEGRTPSRYLRDLLRDAAASVNCAYEVLSRMKKRAAPGSALDLLLVELLAPFDALLARLEPPAPKPAPSTPELVTGTSSD